jgi:hypothetical protein
MKTIIISCDRSEVEEQMLQHIMQYLKDSRYDVSLSTLGPNTHFISAEPEVADEPVATETPPETVELPPEPVAVPSVELPNDIAPTLELPPEPELTVDVPAEPFSSTCKIWDLSSQVSVPCFCNPSAQTSVLCVSQCDTHGDYVLFTYAGMTHKVPKATMIDGCCNKEPIPTDSSIRVSLSIGDGGMCCCLLNVTCDGGEERVILGSDLEHLIPPTEVEVTDGSVSTQ